MAVFDFASMYPSGTKYVANIYHPLMPEEREELLQAIDTPSIDIDDFISMLSKS
jgi:hypothetical protein